MKFDSVFRGSTQPKLILRPNATCGPLHQLHPLFTFGLGRERVYPSEIFYFQYRFVALLPVQITDEEIHCSVLSVATYWNVHLIGANLNYILWHTQSAYALFRP